MTEQPERVELGRVGDLHDVRREPFERICRAVVGLVARAVTTVVEHDDGVIASECGNVIREVFFRAAEPMYQEEARPVAGNLDRQSHTVISRDVHAISRGQLHAPLPFGRCAVVPWSRVLPWARHLGSAR